MLISDMTDNQPSPPLARAEPLLRRKPGTIPVTVRLDPPRYDRLKRLVRRFSTTGQSIIQTALDRSMMTLERERLPRVETEGQSSLFAPAILLERSRKPKQNTFAFVQPEPTIALTYRASVSTHRWLQRRSIETGQTIQEIMTNALKAARGAD